jgi:hypothetical protein
MLTKENMIALDKDAEFARLAAAYLIAQVASESITKLVRNYEAKYFELFTHDRPLHATLLHNSERNPDRHLPPPVITTPKDLYLCEDEQACAEYYAGLAKLHPQAGFTLADPTHCPACVSQHKLARCEQAMLAHAEAKLGIPFTETHLELRERALNILMPIALQNPETEKQSKSQLPACKADLNAWLTAA